MNRLDFFEDYFVKICKNYGITKLNYNEESLELDEKCIRNMVFASDDFNNEYDNLQNHCRKIYTYLKRGFSLKIKSDMNNNYYVLVA